MRPRMRIALGLCCLAAAGASCRSARSGAGGGGATGPDGAAGGTGGGQDGATSSDAGPGEAGVDSRVDPVPPPSDRKRAALRDGWKFIASDTLTGAEAAGFDDGAWAAVSVPHTWDSVTGVVKRTSSWYRTHLAVPAADAQKRVYVVFEGVFQVADVYVNGQHLGQHRGGYTRFLFDATPAIQAGADNLLAVKVSNGDCADCLPDVNARLFKGYGGIYRKAWLLTTSAFHVTTTDFASGGVYVSPSNVTGAAASLSTKILLTNDGAADKTFTVESVFGDAQGNPVLRSQSDVTVAAGATTSTTHAGVLSNPTLWSPALPYLYGVTVTVTVDGLVTDAVVDHVGLRSYQLTTTDFTLNGVSTRLRGVGKHQETELHASAVTDDELMADWDNLRELGVNFVRLVHYPHAQLEYDLADQRGIMVWSENGHTNSGLPTPNGDDITREMVFQNWNHPSIIFWSVGNEAPGVAATSEYAAVVHAADPSRPVVYASNGQRPAGVDLIFANSYAGWYTGTMYDFLSSADHWVSETGAGMVIATHTADAFAMTKTVDSYEPEEYGGLVNEVRFDDLLRNPSHVPAFAGWVFRDISDFKYKGLINTKGLLTFAGYKKDVYYHFASLLRTTPVVHLVAPHYFLRGASPAAQGAIKAYSNAAMLTLSINGASAGAQANDHYTHPNGRPIKNVFYWADALRPGKNVVTVDDGAGHGDSMTVYYLGAATTLPADATARVFNLTSSNGAAYFIDAPIADQHPFYFDFDGTGDNSFDLVPGAVAGASWIATRRQSDAAKTTALAFDVRAAADLYIMFTRQGAVPSWITAAGFLDTGVSGRWRNNDPRLVDYSLYKRTVAAGAHVTLAGTAIDYVVLVK